MPGILLTNAQVRIESGFLVRIFAVAQAVAFLHGHSHDIGKALFARSQVLAIAVS
jgi:hypothetical protein